MDTGALGGCVAASRLARLHARSMPARSGSRWRNSATAQGAAQQCLATRVHALCRLTYVSCARGAVRSFTATLPRVAGGFAPSLPGSLRSWRPVPRQALAVFARAKRARLASVEVLTRGCSECGGGGVIESVVRSRVPRARALGGGNMGAWHMLTSTCGPSPPLALSSSPARLPCARPSPIASSSRLSSPPRSSRFPASPRFRGPWDVAVVLWRGCRSRDVC